MQARNVHVAITAQTKQIQSDYEAKLKQREIVQEVGSADTLTQALIDRLISKVYIFPGDRIEIEYVIHRNKRTGIGCMDREHYVK